MPYYSVSAADTLLHAVTSTFDPQVAMHSQLPRLLVIVVFEHLVRACAFVTWIVRIPLTSVLICLLTQGAAGKSPLPGGR